MSEPERIPRGESEPFESGGPWPSQTQLWAMTLAVPVVFLLIVLVVTA